MLLSYQGNIISCSGTITTMTQAPSPGEAVEALKIIILYMCGTCRAFPCLTFHSNVAVRTFHQPHSFAKSIVRSTLTTFGFTCSISCSAITLGPTVPCRCELCCMILQLQVAHLSTARIGTANAQKNCFLLLERFFYQALHPKIPRVTRLHQLNEIVRNSPQAPRSLCRFQTHWRITCLPVPCCSFSSLVDAHVVIRQALPFGFEGTLLT